MNEPSASDFTFTCTAADLPKVVSGLFVDEVALQHGDISCWWCGNGGNNAKGENNEEFHFDWSLGFGSRLNEELRNTDALFFSESSFYSQLKTLPKKAACDLHNFR